MCFNYSSSLYIGSAVRLKSSTGPGAGGRIHTQRDIPSLGVLQPYQSMKNY